VQGSGLFKVIVVVVNRSANDSLNTFTGLNFYIAKPVIVAFLQAKPIEKYIQFLITKAMLSLL
jgi:hypothetical protein